MIDIQDLICLQLVFLRVVANECSAEPPPHSCVCTVTDSKQSYSATFIKSCKISRFLKVIWPHNVKHCCCGLAAFIFCLSSLPVLFRSASHSKPARSPPRLCHRRVLFIFLRVCLCLSSCLRNTATRLPQWGWRDQRSPDDPQHGHELPKPVAQPSLTHTQQLRFVSVYSSVCLCTCLSVRRLPCGNSLFDLSPF